MSTAEKNECVMKGCRSFTPSGYLELLSWPKQSMKPWQPQENPGYISAADTHAERNSQYSNHIKSHPYNTHRSEQQQP